MNLVETYAAAQAPGMGIIESAAGYSMTQLRALGLSHAHARQIHTLAKIYTGTTKFTAKRAAAIRLAHANKLPLDALQIIETYARRAANTNAAWNIRRELAGCATTSDIKAKGKELTDKPAPNPEPGVKLARRENRNWTLSITGPSALISKLGKAGKTAEDFEEALTTGGLRETITTNLIITPTDLELIQAGRGDEVRVRSTDGAWRPGSQVAEELSAESLRIILQTPAGIGINTYKVVPEEGAVDGGRARFANAKQRIMAAAESPTCAMPGCNHPAETSQIHHLAPWKHGGRTIPPNLCVLCPFHNGRNDDDPTDFRNGTMIRARNRLAWQSPFGKIHYTRRPPPPGATEPQWQLTTTANTA